VSGPSGAEPVGEAVWAPSALQREREAFRRRAVGRSVAIAAVSTVVVVGVLVAAVVGSPGWPRVRETFLDWDEARSVFPAVLAGFWMNVRIFVVASVLVLLVGLLVAIARTLRGPVFFPVRLLAAAYTDLFRGLPLILVILLLGFGVPALRLSGVPDTPVVWGGAALVLTYGAYVAEVIRAGIESVHPSQVAAARSLGLSHAKSLRFVVLPQALRRVVPPLLNDAASLQKDSGLVSILGVIDAVRAAQIETAVSFNYTPYLVAAFLFLLLTIPMVRITDYVSLRALRRQSAGLR
jgi:polar amino acid transport system permease protein